MDEPTRWFRVVVCVVGFSACGYPPLPRVDNTPVDAPNDGPHIAFTWQLATSQMSGAPEPALSDPPFDPVFARQMQIRIATLGGPFADADYLSSPGMEGWIPIPRSYIGTTWRLEYTLPGEIPHEVQWAPDDKLGHLTVPRVGPVDRDPVPGGSGYQITPTNYSGGYTNPRVLTTGLWTDGLVTAPVVGGATVDYDFFNAISLSGPKGRPDTVPGARAMLVDFVTDNSPPLGSRCNRIASGSASVDPTLQAGVHAVQSVTWDRNTRPVDAPPIDKAVFDRLITGPLHGTLNLPASVVLYGAVASTTFPGLVGIPPEFTVVKLPIPAMQILVQCEYQRSPLPNAASPAALDDFPRILHVQLVSTRQALGVDLDSGLETVIASSAGGGFKIAFPAPLAKTMTLTTSTGAIDLTGPVDQIPIGRPDTLTLSFTSEIGSDLRADYHDVLLHKIAGGALTTERIFTVTAPQVHIDGSLLAPSTDYVLEIRTYKGHLMAPRGDFAPVDYPYGAAIVFTRTFRTS